MPDLGMLLSRPSLLYSKHPQGLFHIAVWIEPKCSWGNHLMSGSRSTLVPGQPNRWTTFPHSTIFRDYFTLARWTVPPITGGFWSFPIPKYIFTPYPCQRLPPSISCFTNIQASPYSVSLSSSPEYFLSPCRLLSISTSRRNCFC